MAYNYSNYHVASDKPYYGKFSTLAQRQQGFQAREHVEESDGARSEPFASLSSMTLGLPESPYILPTLRLDLHFDRMYLPLEFLVHLFTFSHDLFTCPGYNLVDGNDGSSGGGDGVWTGSDGEIRFRTQTAVGYRMRNLSRNRSLPLILTSQTARDME
jgi:hypothetical protein